MPDIAASTATIATMAVGQTFRGDLEVRGDRDWIRVNLTAGQTVQINLDGASLSDPYLRIYDAAGQLLAEDDDGGLGRDSQLTYQAGAAGSYYMSAASWFDNDIGTYDLYVTATTPPVPAGPLTSITGDLGLSGQEVRVYFGQAGETFDGVTGEGFTAYERACFRAAFAQIAAVTDLDFRVVNNAENADIRLVLDTNEMPYNTLGYFYAPGSGDLSGVGVFNGAQFDRNGGGNLEAGGGGAATIMHELLHGLGLMHPHDTGGGSTVMTGVTAEFGDFGRADLNQGIFTTMSYNVGYQTGTGNGPVGDLFGYQSGPMALDIAALQLIYGARAHATGNTVYELPGQDGVGVGWQAIWDTGGIDRMSYDGNRDAVLDLRMATLDYRAGGGGFVSGVAGVSGGYTIAKFAVIEQAYGGDGNDRVIGNSANNQLLGRGGFDVIYGLNGDDMINAGARGDVLIGGAGNDRLFGQAGNDRLIGDQGGDMLHGGTGDDQFVFRRVADSLTGAPQRDTILDFTRGADKINLAALDGNLAQAGNQTLHFIGGAGFDGADRQGDVRFQRVAGGDIIVAVDIDGDGGGDMHILVQDVAILTPSDFIL